MEGLLSTRRTPSSFTPYCKKPTTNLEDSIMPNIHYDCGQTEREGGRIPGVIIREVSERTDWQIVQGGEGEQYITFKSLKVCSK